MLHPTWSNTAHFPRSKAFRPRVRRCLSSNVRYTKRYERGEKKRERILESFLQGRWVHMTLIATKASCKMKKRKKTKQEAWWRRKHFRLCSASWHRRAAFRIYSAHAARHTRYTLHKAQRIYIQTPPTCAKLHSVYTCTPTYCDTRCS